MCTIFRSKEKETSILSYPINIYGEWTYYYCDKASWEQKTLMGKAKTKCHSTVYFSVLLMH